MAPKTVSRLEANREVRRIFVRHGIDTTKVHFSVAGRTLLLTGGLYKEGGQDVDTKNIDTVMQELGRLGVTVSCELENWIITEGNITKKGGPAVDPAAQANKVKEAAAATVNKGKA
ncbi:MAG: hypothetical protein WC635_00550 [Bacteriovorax sp.]|jgi:hypothetical protein